MSELCILLVDDHHDGLRFLSKLLRSHGHSVHTASTVVDARRLAEEHHCDLLIADLDLPDGSGLDLLRELRERQPIPAIALTGHGGREVECQTREAGFARHLTKPIVFADLLAAVAEATSASVDQLHSFRPDFHADGQATPLR